MTSKYKQRLTSATSHKTYIFNTNTRINNSFNSFSIPYRCRTKSSSTTTRKTTKPNVVEQQADQRSFLQHKQRVNKNFSNFFCPHFKKY